MSDAVTTGMERWRCGASGLCTMMLAALESRVPTDKEDS